MWNSWTDRESSLLHLFPGRWHRLTPTQHHDQSAIKDPHFYAVLQTAWNLKGEFDSTDARFLWMCSFVFFMSAHLLQQGSLITLRSPRIAVLVALGLLAAGAPQNHSAAWSLRRPHSFALQTSWERLPACLGGTFASDSSKHFSSDLWEAVRSRLWS